MDIELECAEARLRLEAAFNARLLMHEADAHRRYVFAMRSISQTARRIRERILGVGRGAHPIAEGDDA